MKNCFRFWKGNEAAEIAEFAIVLPILLLLVLAMFWVGQAYNISNNLNNVMKRLTSITIILSLPILVTSIYGMNVAIPYPTTPHAFYIPVVLSITASVIIAWYFMKKK